MAHTPVWQQTHFRAYVDDAALNSATAIAAEDANFVRSVDGNLRVRFLVQETAGAAGSVVPTLYYSVGSNTAFTRVNGSSSFVRSAASPNVTDGATISTSALTGSGTYAAGNFDEVDGAAASISTVASGYTEVEFCVQLRSADFTNGNVVRLRVQDDTTSFGGAYTEPTITVHEYLATLTGSATQATSLTTEITFDTDTPLTGSATQTADVTTEITLDTSLTGSATQTVPTITTEITLDTSLTGSGTQGDATLRAAEHFDCELTGSATQATVLTTEITLDTSLTGSADLAPLEFTIPILLDASLTGSGTQTAATIITEINLATNLTADGNVSPLLLPTVVRYVNTNSTAGGDGTTNLTTGPTRAYVSLAAWNTAEATNLVTAQSSHTVYCCGGQDTSGPFDLDGWTTNSEYVLRIESNLNEVDGRNTTGSFDSSGYYTIVQSGNDEYTFRMVTKEQDIRFIGLQVLRTIPAASSATIHRTFDFQSSAGGGRYWFDGCWIKNSTQKDIANYGIHSRGTGTTRLINIWNSIFEETYTTLETDLVPVTTSSRGLFISPGNASGQSTVYNSMFRGFMDGIHDASGHLTVKNSIAIDNSNADFFGSDLFYNATNSPLANNHQYLSYIGSEISRAASVQLDTSPFASLGANSDVMLPGMAIGDIDTTLVVALTRHYEEFYNDYLGLYSPNNSLELAGTGISQVDDPYVPTYDIKNARRDPTNTSIGPLETTVALVDASVIGAATQAADITTQITLDTTLTANGAISVELLVPVLFDTDLTGSATQAADLTVAQAVLLDTTLTGSATQVADVTTEITANTSLTGTATETADITTEITVDTNLTGAASQVADVTTEITVDTTLTGTATETADITTDITASTSLTGSATQAADVTTEITFDTTLTGTGTITDASLTAGNDALGTVNITGTATTDIELTNQITATATLAATATQTVNITTEIPVDTTLTGTATETADITTEITAATELTGTATETADITTEITAATELTGVVTISTELTIPILLDTALTGQATETADITTEITAATELTGAAAQDSSLTTEITVDSAISASATQAVDLTTQITFDTSLTGSATQDTSVTTEVTFAASLTATASTTVQLTTEITFDTTLTGSATQAVDNLSTLAYFDTALSGSATQTVDLTTEITFNTDLTGSATTSSLELTVPIHLDTSLTAQGTEVADLTTLITMTTELSSDGTIDAALLNPAEFDTDLTGQAAVDVITLRVQALLATDLTGTATLDARTEEPIELFAVVNMESSLSASLYSADSDIGSGIDSQYIIASPNVFIGGSPALLDTRLTVSPNNVYINGLGVLVA